MVVSLHMNTCVLTSAISESSGELDMVRSRHQAAQYSRSALYREAEKSQHQPGTSLQHQSQHWPAIASTLFSRAVGEGSRSFHNHGEGPPVSCSRAAVYTLTAPPVNDCEMVCRR